MAKHIQFPDETELRNESGSVGDLRCALEVPDPSTPQTILEETEKSTVVQDAVSGMTPEHQRVLTMRYQDDMSLKQMAVILRVSKSSVSRMLDTARSRMRTSLAIMNINDRSDLEA